MKPTYTDKNTGISYTLVGNIYLPNLVLPHCDYSIGLWGSVTLNTSKPTEKDFTPH